MGMEYSLRKVYDVSSCDWVERMLDWETNELGFIFAGVILEFFFKRSVKVSLVGFFSKLPQNSVKVSLVGFFSKLSQNEFSFPG